MSRDISQADLFQKRHNDASARSIQAPLYADWSHVSLQVSSPPVGFPPEPVVLPKTTTTQAGIVAMCIPSLLQPPHLRGTTPSIHCWTKTSTESTSNPQQEIAKAIVQQYQQCIPGISLAARVNPTIVDVKTSFDRLKTVVEKRFLFHYVSYGAVDVTAHDIGLHSADKLSFDRFPIESVLNASAPCAVHILDCDFAGLLASTYQSFIRESAEMKKDVDLFAFFACGAREKLPRSPGLPFDLFTSCMTTPGRTALLWHSRHYYCFKNGPLRPLEPDFYEHAPPAVINEITIILHRLVEAMACEMFPPDLFLKVFHSDSTLAHFAANFFLAARILSFFGVMPLSVPAMPDLRNHQLWHSFDLRLDVALLQLTSPSPAPSLTYTAFLEQSLQTLRHLMTVSTKDVSFPSQLTQLPPVLTTPALKEVGCEVLSQYIDKSVQAIRQIMHFPIVVPLFQLFPQRIGGDNLLLSMAKILCFMPETREILDSFSNDVFEELIFPLFETEKPLLPVIIATMVINRNDTKIKQIDGKWEKYVLPLLKHKHSDVRLWSLLFISCFIQKVSGGENVISSITPLLQDDCPEVRIASIYTLSYLLGRNSDALLGQEMVKLYSDPCPSVRLQLVMVLNKLPRTKELEKAMEVLKRDPHSEIHRLLTDEEDTVRESYIFEWFSSYLFSPIRNIVEDPSKTISQVQPITVQLVKAHTTPTTQSSFQKVQMGPTIASVNAITSNFTNTIDNQFIFGTKAGEICSCTWGEQQKPRARKISGSAICHVNHIFNSGFPITMASNMDGYLYMMQFNENELNLVSGFKANDTSFSFECDEYNRRIFALSDVEPKEVMIYDLTKERRDIDLVPTYGRPKAVRPIAGLDDIVAVCTEKVELFDTRAGVRSVMTFEGLPEAYDVCPIGRNSSSFAVCHTTPVVSLFDARTNESMKRFQVSSENLTTLSFAAHAPSSSVAIGNSKGVFMLSVLSGKMMEFTMVSQLFFSSKKVQAVSQCIFHPSKFNLSILQESNEVMTLVEDRG